MLITNYNKTVLYTHESGRTLDEFITYLRESSPWYLVVDWRKSHWTVRAPAYLMKNTDVTDLISRSCPTGPGKYTCQVSTFITEVLTDTGVIYIYCLDPGRLSDIEPGPDVLAYPKVLSPGSEREVRMAVRHFN